MFVWTCHKVTTSILGRDSAPFRRLVIFGDSYSSVDNLETKVKPDANEPLGVPFPGITWNEPERPNWVGHLITKYCPEPRYRPSDAKRYGNSIDNIFNIRSCLPGDKAQAAWANSPFLVHDYDKGGERVPGVRRQILELFLPGVGVGTKPDWATWTANETLFVTWVGITIAPMLPKKEFKVLSRTIQRDLYDAGARNFLFIDLPTIHRDPQESVPIWKLSLRRNSRHGMLPYTTQHRNLGRIIQMQPSCYFLPLKYGFHSEDVKCRNGSIWMYHIHPISKVHDYIARRLAMFLDSVQPVSKEDTVSLNTDNVYDGTSAKRQYGLAVL